MDKATKDRKAKLLQTHADLKYATIKYPESHTDMWRTAMDAVLHLATVLEILADVEDAVNQPGLPCPVQSQTCVQKLRQLLGVPAWTKQVRTAETPRKAVKPEPLICGKGPYRAEIVPTAGGDPIWTSARTYRTEKQVFCAIIRKAKILKHRLAGYTRGWTTEKNEFMVDYGSYTHYGRVTSITK